ncbi:MAG: hypothetical protein J1F66_02220 [Clostridiales bacterium]|nr:hypothetical protein [Clostridiales bacterium]
MKATFKNVAIALAILVVVVSVLAAVDANSNMAVAVANTYIKIAVVDLDGSPVHNAKVTVGEVSFYTDNKGLSPSIELATLSNSYDAAITEWGTVTVVVEKDGYVPTFVFNCVVYNGQTRKLTVRTYTQDGSELPYVSYVESPPDGYVQELLSANN